MAGYPHNPRVPPLMPTPQSTQPNIAHTPLLPETPAHAAPHLLQSPWDRAPPMNPPHLLPQPTGILAPPHSIYKQGQSQRGGPYNYQHGPYRPPHRAHPYQAPHNRTNQGQRQGRYFDNSRYFGQRGGGPRGRGRFQRRGNSRGGYRGGGGSGSIEDYYNQSMFEDPWTELIRRAYPHEESSKVENPSLSGDVETDKVDSTPRPSETITSETGEVTVSISECEMSEVSHKDSVDSTEGGQLNAHTSEGGEVTT